MITYYTTEVDSGFSNILVSLELEVVAGLMWIISLIFFILNSVRKMNTID